MLKRTLMAVTLALGTSGTQADLADCHGIQDASQRLACYDRISGRVPVAGRAEGSPVISPSVNPSVEADDRPVPQSGTSTTASAKAPGATVQSGAAAVDDRFGLQPERSLVPGTLTATLSRVERNRYGKLTVYLENDQVWRQLDSSRLLLSTGDEVVIREASLGSHLLEKQSGSRSIRVKRLR